MPDWRKSYDDGTAAYKAKDFNKAMRLLNEVRVRGVSTAIQRMLILLVRYSH